MKHFLSSFALSLGLAMPLLAACGGSAADGPSGTASGDDTASGASGSESVDTVDSEVKSGKKKSKKTCASVGGACVALTPSSCAGGQWADASKVTCGGGLGVGCCVSAPPPPPPPPPPVCPELVPPPPGFCPGGSVVPRHDASTGCITGFDCVPAPTNACIAAGGACVALTPSSCAAGHWGDASTHSCGGGLGVGCCLP